MTLEKIDNKETFLLGGRDCRVRRAGCGIRDPGRPGEGGAGMARGRNRGETKTGADGIHRGRPAR